MQFYQYSLQTCICLDLEGWNLFGLAKMYVQVLQYWTREDRLWQHLQATVWICLCGAADACQPCSPIP